MPVFYIKFFDEAEAIACNVPTSKDARYEAFDTLLEMARKCDLKEKLSVLNAEIFDRERRPVGQIELRISINGAF